MFEFSRADRLLKSLDFKAAMDQGAKLVNPNLVVLARKAATDRPRLGVIVSRKVGNAVVRNRVKRYLRESFRLRKQHYAGFDIVVIARPRAAQVEHVELTRSLEQSVDRLQEKKSTRLG